MAAADLNDKTPVSPIDFTESLFCPLIGIFGNDDRTPSPEQVNQHEEVLKQYGKTYEFHRYDGARRASELPAGTMHGCLGQDPHLLRQTPFRIGGSKMSSIIVIVRAEGMAKRGEG